MKNQMKCAAGLLPILFAFMGCSKESAQTANLQVRLSDAPGDFKEVNIDIEGVQVNTDSSSASSGWKSLNIKKGVYNLLKLTNGLDTLLGNIQLPEGQVSQLRLILGSNNTVNVSGQPFALNTPSGQQSGLKIQVHTTLKAGITYKIILDFDAARSIVLTGSGKFNLKPVIRSAVEAESGAIKGIVTPMTSTPAVFVINGQDTIASTYTDPFTGKFLINGVVPGAYTVWFSPKSGYQAMGISNVNVTLGNVTNIDTVRISQ